MAIAKTESEKAIGQVAIAKLESEKAQLEKQKAQIATQQAQANLEHAETDLKFAKIGTDLERRGMLAPSHHFRKPIAHHPIPGAIGSHFLEARSGKSAVGSIGWLFAGVRSRISSHSDRSTQNTNQNLNQCFKVLRNQKTLWVLNNYLVGPIEGRKSPIFSGGYSSVENW